MQDLLSQQKQRAVSLEECLGVLCTAYLDRKDPLKTARRAKTKSKSLRVLKPVEPKEETQPKKIPRATLHKLNLQTEMRCTRSLPNGTRCTSTRWLENHHLKPLSQGGTHELSNLTVLCRAHHQQHHASPFPSPT